MSDIKQLGQDINQVINGGRADLGGGLNCWRRRRLPRPGNLRHGRVLQPHAEARRQCSNGTCQAGVCAPSKDAGPDGGTGGGSTTPTASSTGGAGPLSGRRDRRGGWSAEQRAAGLRVGGRAKSAIARDALAPPAEGEQGDRPKPDGGARSRRCRAHCNRNLRAWCSRRCRSPWSRLLLLRPAPPPADGRRERRRLRATSQVHPELHSTARVVLDEARAAGLRDGGGGEEEWPSPGPLRAGQGYATARSSTAGN